MAGAKFDATLDKILKKYGVDGSAELDINDLVYVNAALAGLADKWHLIGTDLGVSDTSLAIIKANYPVANVGRCLIDALAEWLKKSGSPATWMEVVKVALKHSGQELAEEIAENSKRPHSFLTVEISGVNIANVDGPPLKDFGAMVSALYDAEVTEQWLEIGLFLGISYSDLQTLREKPDDEKVHGMVRFWSKWKYDTDTFGKPSWRNLVCAIGARPGGKNEIGAKKLAAADHSPRQPQHARRPPIGTHVKTDSPGNETPSQSGINEPVYKAPDGLAIVNIKATSVTVEWDPCENEPNYTVEYKLSHEKSWKPSKARTEYSPKKKYTAKISKLTANNKYDFKVAATYINAQGMSKLYSETLPNVTTKSRKTVCEWIQTYPGKVIIVVILIISGIVIALAVPLSTRPGSQPNNSTAI